MSAARGSLPQAVSQGILTQRINLPSCPSRPMAVSLQMDKEVNSLKAAMEQSKNDTVKYVLGLMLALLTAGLGAARLLMH